MKKIILAMALGGGFIFAQSAVVDVFNPAIGLIPQAAAGSGNFSPTSGATTGAVLCGTGTGTYSFEPIGTCGIAPIASPTFTGTVTLPTTVLGTGTSGDIVTYTTSNQIHDSGTLLSNLTPATLTSTSGPVADPGGFSVFQYNNASGALTFDLPAGVANYQRCYRNATGKTGVITIAVTTSNTIDLNGTNGTATTGTLVSGGAAGDAVCLVSDATNHWYAYVQKGTWTNN
jgi:hypothetical protein